MYDKFYGFRAEPFRLSPDHRFCYSHKSYARAKAYMQYAFERAEGFVMVTGRPGTGKTTLVNDLVTNLPTSKVKVAMIVCTQLEANDLLHMVASAFGVSSNIERKALLLQHLQKLFYQWFQEGRRALLIIDEAQDLSRSALEELRLLTNLQINNQPLLQIFLLGQEEFREMVNHSSMEQVHQRMVAACHLKTLELEETKAYIKHRLQQVGWQNKPAISEAVYPVIHKFSAGIPRRINMVCSRLLLHGCVEELDKLGIADAKTVIEEITQEQLTSENILSELDFETADYFEMPDRASVSTIAPAQKKNLKTVEKETESSSRPTQKKEIRKGEYAVSIDVDESPVKEKEKEDQVYRGVDTRVGPRRFGKDRRQTIRFESRGDRRKNAGRRKADIVSMLLSQGP